MNLEQALQDTQCYDLCYDLQDIDSIYSICSEASSASQAAFSSIPKSIPKANPHGNHQTETKKAGSPLVVVVDRPLLLNLVHAPQKQSHAVEYRSESDYRKSPSRSHGDAVTEVQKRGCY